MTQRDSRRRSRLSPEEASGRGTGKRDQVAPPAHILHLMHAPCKLSPARASVPLLVRAFLVHLRSLAPRTETTSLRRQQHRLEALAIQRRTREPGALLKLSSFSVKQNRHIRHMSALRLRGAGKQWTTGDVTRQERHQTATADDDELCKAVRTSEAETCWL